MIARRKTGSGVQLSTRTGLGWWLPVFAVVLLQGLGPLLTGAHLVGAFDPCDDCVAASAAAFATPADTHSDEHDEPDHPGHRHHDETTCATCQLLAIAHKTTVFLVDAGIALPTPCVERIEIFDRAAAVCVPEGPRTSRGPPTLIG